MSYQELGELVIGLVLHLNQSKWLKNILYIIIIHFYLHTYLHLK